VIGNYWYSTPVNTGSETSWRVQAHGPTVGIGAHSGTFAVWGNASTVVNPPEGEALIRKSKFALLGTAVVLVASTLGMGSATAGPPKIDVSGATIACDTVVGTVGFKPALSATGTATSDAITIKGTIDGCTVTGAA